MLRGATFPNCRTTSKGINICNSKLLGLFLIATLDTSRGLLIFSTGFTLGLSLCRGLIKGSDLVRPADGVPSRGGPPATGKVHATVSLGGRHPVARNSQIRVAEARYV